MCIKKKGHLRTLLLDLCKALLRHSHNLCPGQLILRLSHSLPATEHKLSPFVVDIGERATFRELIVIRAGLLSHLIQEEVKCDMLALTLFQHIQDTLRKRTVPLCRAIGYCLIMATGANHPAALNLHQFVDRQLLVALIASYKQ